MSISGFKNVMPDRQAFAAVLVRSSSSPDCTCQGHVCFLFCCNVSQIWELLMVTISLVAALNMRPYRDTAVPGYCVTRLTDVLNDLKPQPLITSEVLCSDITVFTFCLPDNKLSSELLEHHINSYLRIPCPGAFDCFGSKSFRYNMHQITSPI